MKVNLKGKGSELQAWSRDTISNHKEPSVVAFFKINLYRFELFS